MRIKKKDAQEEFKKHTYPHMNLVYNVALKYCGNIFDAEDIVQETYLMAFYKFHQLREKSKCKPWLLKILRNNFLKNCHKQKKQNRLSEAEYVEFLKSSFDTQSADQILAKRSDRDAIQHAIDKLPEKYKTVLLFYYMDDLLYKEIASSLKIPIGTVMSRLTRAREGLKAILLKQALLSKNNILGINLNKQKVRAG